jgi:hypothetical protein
MITKICSGCKLDKSLDNFYPRKRYKYKVDSICKTCISIKNKGKKMTEKQLEKNKQKTNNYRKNYPEKYKWSIKQSIYKKLGLNISKEEYDTMLQNQNGKCVICNNPPLGFKKSLCLDHCHSSLKIRGLLCDNCNAGLGKFKDDVQILKNAILYLEKFKTIDSY